MTTTGVPCGMQGRSRPTIISVAPAVSLAAAQRALVAGGPPLSHPFDWAPLVLVGEAPRKAPAKTGTAVSVKGRQEEKP